MKERDEMIRGLKIRSSEQLERLVRGSDEQARDWQEQKTALEQHYEQVIAEINSRNEVITAVLVWVLNFFLCVISRFSGG